MESRSIPIPKRSVLYTYKSTATLGDTNKLFRVPRLSDES